MIRPAIELIVQPNLLKAKTGGGGGIDIATALRRAESALEDIRDSFAGWAAEDVTNLASAYAAFAVAPGAKSHAALGRAAIDLKGQAATFGYPLIARVAASLARLLDESIAPPSTLVEAHVSAVLAIHRDGETGTPLAEALAQELEDRVAETLEPF